MNDEEMLRHLRRAIMEISQEELATCLGIIASYEPEEWPSGDGKIVRKWMKDGAREVHAILEKRFAERMR